MKKIFISLIVLFVLVGAACAQTTPKTPQSNLKIGDAAPEFVLNDTDGKTVKLSDFKDKKSVVLAFYVLAFTGG